MNIYVSNLSFDVTDNDLKQLFAPYGNVTSAKIINDRDTGRSRGFGFVEMGDKQEALKAIAELHNTEYEGKVLNINEARPKTDKPRGSYGNDTRSRGGYDNDRYSKKW
jgi:RNA recognition motif-containing protein